MHHQALPRGKAMTMSTLVVITFADHQANLSSGSTSLM
jgi:hypothetical protein